MPKRKFLCQLTQVMQCELGGNLTGQKNVSSGNCQKIGKLKIQIEETLSGSELEDFIAGYKKFNRLQPNGCGKEHVLDVIDTAKYYLDVVTSNTSSTSQEVIASIGINNFPDDVLCNMAVSSNGNWETDARLKDHVREAKHRGLSCGVSETSTIQTASSTTTQSDTPTDDISGSIWRIYEDDGEITVFHFNQDGTVSYLILSSTHNQGETYNDGHDLWSTTDDFIEISFSNGHSNMTLKFDNSENRVRGTLVLNSGEIKRVGGHLENENVKFVGGKFFNVQKPSQKTIDKQIALLKNTPKAQIASSATMTQSNTPTSAELEAERKKRVQLKNISSPQSPARAATANHIQRHPDTTHNHYSIRCRWT